MSLIFRRAEWSWRVEGMGALLELVRRQPGAGCLGRPMGAAELPHREPRAEGGCLPGSGHL